MGKMTQNYAQTVGLTVLCLSGLVESADMRSKAGRARIVDLSDRNQKSFAVSVAISFDIGGRDLADASAVQGADRALKTGFTC